MVEELLEFTARDERSTAAIEVDAERHASWTVRPELFGKFSEHLGRNVYNGMSAQILSNPTFGRWHFGADESSVDGGTLSESTREAMHEHIEEHARVDDLPDARPLVEAYDDGLAFWWTRVGERDAVRVSPDVGPGGNRAQRVEIEADDADVARGIQQWTALPAHRTRTVEFRATIRATSSTPVTLALSRIEDEGPGTRLDARTLDATDEWTTFEGELTVPERESATDPAQFSLSITADDEANFVVDRVLLFPDDHVNEADLEVVEYYEEMDLPLLRWPGGNFVSDYHWRDGVGPVESRPTRRNPAWSGLEYNLFGTDEFVGFCDAVGCEPLVCVNAGSGTPAEAARWVEYCNGSTDMPMGRLRAEHGHPEPYDVRYWEIGNELWGDWQVGRTTPDGYIDRYERFREAMLERDPSIDVYACGNQSTTDSAWNDHVIDAVEGDSLAMTDHVLPRLTVDETSDADAVFETLMSHPIKLGRSYRQLRAQMESAGIENPGLAITELQLFPHLHPDAEAGEDLRRLYSPVWCGGRTLPRGFELPSNKTIAEPLYAMAIVNECIRMGEFVDLITHTATVNHGGGLQKRDERTWADPSHYGHEIYSRLANAVPVHVSLECGTFDSDGFGSDSSAEDEPLESQIDPERDVPVLDVVAAVDREDDELLVAVLHRAADVGPVSATIDLSGVELGSEASVTTLSTESYHVENSLEDPARVAPADSTAAIEDGGFSLTAPPYSIQVISIPVE